MKTIQPIRFSSNRERRLWFITGSAVVAIYSTLGLAGSIVEELERSGLLSVFFFVAFVFSVLIIIGSAILNKIGSTRIWVTAAITIVFGMTVLRMGISPVERTHIFEYGLLAILIHEALTERNKNVFTVRWPSLIAIIITILLGFIDEGIQYFIPNRVFDLRDLIFNTAAATTATITKILVARIPNAQP